MEILAAQAWLQQAAQVRLPGCSVACGTPEHLGQCGERGRGECGWWWWQSSAAFWLFTQGCTQWSRGCLYIWLIHKLSVCTAWIIHDFVWGEEWVFQHTTKGTSILNFSYGVGMVPSSTVLLIYVASFHAVSSWSLPLPNSRPDEVW